MPDSNYRFNPRVVLQSNQQFYIKNWNLSYLVFESLISVVDVGANPRCVFFKPDGLKMYVFNGAGGTVQIGEYNLSVAWDVTTATLFQLESVAAQITNGYGIFIRGDGLKLYVTEFGVSDSVYEYDLGVAWDISTTSFLQSKSVAVQDLSPTGIFFKPDGFKMYVSGNSGDRVYEYDLGTAWDISTAVFLQSISISIGASNYQNIFISEDGLHFYIADEFNAINNIDEWVFGTAWNVSTLTFVRSFDTTAHEGAPTGQFWKADGSIMFVVGSTNDRVTRYDII